MKHGEKPVVSGNRSRLWASRMLRLYPREWRERYQTEVELLLQDHRAGPWTVVDMALGAVDAHVHRNLLPERLTSMAHRIRSSEIALFCAYILFLVPWLALQRIPDPIPEWQTDVLRVPALAPLFTIQQAAGYLAFLAVLAGGVPILLTAFYQALLGRRRDVLLPLAGAAALVVVYAGLAIAVYLEINDRPGTGVRPLRPIDVVLTGVWLVASLVGAVLGPYLVSVAIARSELGTSLLRFALVPAAVTTGAILIGVAAMTALNLVAVLRSPDLFNPSISPVALLFMIAAAVLALVSFWRGISARPDPSVRPA